jgi:hypothetical protein
LGDYAQLLVPKVRKIQPRVSHSITIKAASSTLKTHRKSEQMTSSGRNPLREGILVEVFLHRVIPVKGILMVIGGG